MYCCSVIKSMLCGYICLPSRNPTFSKYLHAGDKKADTLLHQLLMHSMKANTISLFFYWLQIFSDPLVLSRFVSWIWLFIHLKEVELWSLILLNVFYSFWYMVKQAFVMWNKYLNNSVSLTCRHLFPTKGCRFVAFLFASICIFSPIRVNPVHSSLRL